MTELGSITPEQWRRWGVATPNLKPLGTADWFKFPAGTKPTFTIGDLWLSRLPTGEPVGFRDDRHVLLCSGTRAGKGTSILIPNLLLWPGSVVVIDPKGENAAVTARRRGMGSIYAYGMGQQVHLLDPFKEARGNGDYLSDLRARFNPIDLLGVDNPEAIEEAGKIAASIVVEQSNDPFWENAAQGILAKLCLHVASWPDYAPEDRNLLTVRRLLVEGEGELRELLSMSIDPKELPSGLALLFSAMTRNKAYGGVVARAGAQLLGMELGSPKMLFSILQVAVTNTDFMDGPAMQHCLGGSSFSLKSLKADPKGVSLYLCLPQRYMPTHFRWLRMMTTLILNEMERTRQQPATGHPVLMILDEFAGLKRMAVIENAAAQIAGFGVKLMFVVQTLAQLKDVYRDNWETLLANAGTKLFFGNDDHFTREYVSKLIGEHEVIRETWSESVTKGASLANAYGETFGTTSSVARSQGSNMSSGGRNTTYGISAGTTATSGSSHSTSWTTTNTSNESQTVGRSQTVHKRWLLTPDEVGRVFGDRQNPRALVLISGMQPLALNRSHYFRDETFAARFDPHADHPLPVTCADHERRVALREQQAAARRAQQVAEVAKAEARRMEEQRSRERDVALRRRMAEIRAEVEQENERKKDLFFFFLKISLACVVIGILVALRLGGY